MTLNQTVHVAEDGAVTYGGAVRHEAANIPCYQPLGERKDPESGVVYTLHCKRRAGHDVPKGEAPHVPVDWRVVAAPGRRVHEERFQPNLIPYVSGRPSVLSITLPHDCANHTADTEEVLRRGW